jgi:glycosyltransferase involved in cell wall biosynthesis
MSECNNPHKIKVLITLIDLHFGGISNLVLQSTPALSERFNTTVVYFGSNEDMLTRFKDSGIDLVRIPYSGGKDIIKTAFKLSQYIKQNKVEVVSTNFLPDKTIVGLARVFTKFKIIATIHNSFNPEITPINKGLRFWFEEFFHNRIANKVLAVSECALNNAIKFRSLKNPQKSVLYSGIKPLSNYVDHIQLTNNGPVQLVTTCRVVPIKGLDRLISCLNDPRIRNKSWILKIVGEGDLKRELQQKVIDYGLESKIHFIGYQNDVKSILVNSHYYVNSSYNEALGISLIEAMSLGLPLIGSNVGGIPEIINENENGFLVDFNNIEEATNTFLKAININPHEYNRLSNNSFESFHNKFSSDKYVRTFEKEIIQLLNNIEK